MTARAQNLFLSYGVTPVTATWVASTASGTDGTGFTFTNHAIGTASATRMVVVGIVGGNGNASTTIPTVTIGGNNATVLNFVTAGTAQPKMAWAGLNVSSGTTANIVVTWNVTMNQCGISVWAVEGMGVRTFATHDHKSATGSSAGLTGLTASNLIKPQGGAILSQCYFVDTTAGLTGVSATNITEVSDIAVEGAQTRAGWNSLSNQNAGTVSSVCTANLDGDLGGAYSAISLKGI